MVEGIRPVRHLVEHAVLQHRPGARTPLLAFAVLWIAHARALKFAGVSQRDSRSTRGSPRWRCWRSAGSSPRPPSITGPSSAAPARAASRRRDRLHDAVFHQPLSFYLFDCRSIPLPRLYAGAGDRLHPALLGGGPRLATAPPPCRTARNAGARRFRLSLEGGLESRFLRGAGAWSSLLAFAVRFFLAAIEMVYNEHGTSWWASITWTRTSGCRCNGW